VVSRSAPTAVPDGDELAALRSGGFPYWAVPRDLWRTVLESAGALRLGALTLDLAWPLHEPAPGLFDWGASRPELAIGVLLGLAERQGLRVLIRPGPRLGAPAPGDGLPAWLRDRGIDSIGPAGRRLPIPSYGSAELERAARRWLREVFEQVRPYRFPRGPVVGCVIGDLTPAPAPWPGGALDRSAGAERLVGRYRSVKYGGAPPDSIEGEGSVALADRLDRVEAGEVARRLVLRWAIDVRTERDAGAIPVLAEVGDSPSGAGGDPRAARDLADGVLLELPEGSPLDYTDLRLLGLRAASLRLPSGVSRLAAPHPLLESPHDLDLPTAAAVLAMSGVRMLDIRSLVPPLRGGGEAPLGSRGELTSTGRRLGDLFRMLEAIDHAALKRRTSAVLLVNRELTRLRESSAEHFSLPAGLAPPRAMRALRPTCDDDEGDRPALDHDVAFEGLFDGLRRVGVPLGIADTSIAVEDLDRVGVAFLVGFDRMSRQLAKRLFEWVAEGGTLVLGPRLPQRDWAGGRLALRLPLEVKERRPRVAVGGLVLEDVETYRTGDPVIETRDGVLASSCSLGKGRLVAFGFRLPFGAITDDPDGLGWLVARLAGAAGVRPCYPSSQPAVETELFEGELRRFLFIANPSSNDRQVTLLLEENESIREVRGSGEHVRPGQAFTVPAATVLVRELVRL
jgi:beta-galactosidase